MEAAKGLGLRVEALGPSPFEIESGSGLRVSNYLNSLKVLQGISGVIVIYIYICVYCLLRGCFEFRLNKAHMKSQSCWSLSGGTEQEIDNAGSPTCASELVQERRGLNARV